MRNRFAFVVATIFLGMSGCLYHGGYYPNGYYGGPSVLPSQPWTGYPSGPNYQPGGAYPSGPIYQPGAPTTQPGTYPTPIDGTNPYVPANPGTTPGAQPYSPSDPNQPSTYGTPSGGNTGAPTFNPNNPGTVPNPGDDDFNRSGGGAQRPTISPTSGARGGDKVRDDLSFPSGPDSSRLERKFQEPLEMEADTPFEQPVIQASATGGSDVRFADQQAEATPLTVKVYSSDPQFQWVQGVLEYDDPSNTWVIMYNDNPRASDQYGGELTLADDPSLARFRSGDVVRIYGSIDPSERDSRRKPVYRMTRAQSIKKAPR